MNKLLCIETIEALDNVMLEKWFHLNLRDKLIEDICNHYGFKEEDLKHDKKGEKQE